MAASDAARAARAADVANASLIVPLQADRLLRHTKSNEPILHSNKITYAHFVRAVWVLTNTNLPIKDFEVEFEAELIRMFYPVKVEAGS